MATSPTATPSAAAPLRAERRRLAENVICLFAEDRPPVINRPRRGRLPSCVVSARRFEELRHSWQRPGIEAELCGTVRAEKKGMRVCLIELRADGDWAIAAVRGRLTVEEFMQTLGEAMHVTKIVENHRGIGMISNHSQAPK